MISDEEYKKGLEKQFEIVQERNKETLRKKNTLVITGLGICGGVCIFSLLLSMVLSFSTFIDFIFEISSIGVGIFIIAYVYNNFKILSFPKKKLSYLKGESKFEYKPTYASKEVFMKNLTNYGFVSLFIKINEKVVCLDAKVKETGKEGLDNVSECHINFSDAIDVNTLLNCVIDGIRIGDIEKFEILSINFDDPMNFIIK